ncbi:MAG: dimethyl sulfoxide reductase anchor subunit [Acidobacteria bacterium]|nr:dimethyl sulfoxide reductase anchor subunit [Acidobacteriota bacterium]
MPVPPVMTPVSERGQPSALLDHYLRQQPVTAVDRFAQAHEDGSAATEELTRRYSALMPASPPAEGQQYAFDVDLDACSGCKSCVAACHALNGLEDDESWRDVGLLHGGSADIPVLQHVTTACHHCLDPACLNACPVDAYEKDPVTGIVKHLDDQCFGCQYCTLACPYDAPKYSEAKGIVRKCDMCSDRLAVGEAPACVQSCPNGAIAIRVVSVDQVLEDSETQLFVPGAPEPRITLPTTSYRTTRVLPRNLVPADYYAVRPKAAHWPLIVMLVMTQMSVGAFLVEQAMSLVGPTTLMVSMRPLHSASALVYGLLALAVSVSHLGRPQYAFRAVIGLRHSWLSREIVAFGLFAGLAVVYAAWPTVAVFVGLRSGPAPGWLGWAVSLSGLAGIACSVMVYQFTQRDFWNGWSTGCKFLLTMTVLGLAAACLSLMATEVWTSVGVGSAAVDLYGALLCRSLMVAATVKLLFETSLFRHLSVRSNSSVKRTAQLMTGALAQVTMARFAAGVLGGLAMPALVLLSRAPASQGYDQGLVLVLLVGLLFVACLAGELLERYLFFAAVASPKMPGGL